MLGARRMKGGKIRLVNRCSAPGAQCPRLIHAGTRDGNRPRSGEHGSPGMTPFLTTRRIPLLGCETLVS